MGPTRSSSWSARVEVIPAALLPSSPSTASGVAAQGASGWPGVVDIPRSLIPPRVSEALYARICRSERVSHPLVHISRFASDCALPQRDVARTGARGILTGMAYDEGLAERIRDVLEGEPGITEKKMFGGLAFLVNGNMAVAAGDEGSMMFRRDPDRDDPVGPHIKPQLMGERVMSGWLHVDAEGVESDEALRDIVERGLGYARTLPPK